MSAYDLSDVVRGVACQINLADAGVGVVAVIRLARRQSASDLSGA
ncbi:MAG: hypothetical protein AAF458_18000 [Pseudomonadota bacterium]